MRVLGLDPSLTAFGWAVHNTSAAVGTDPRCECRGRFQTSARMLFIDRYTEMRGNLRALVREVKPDRVGIEFPVFKEMYSEGMYGLFLFSCEALRLEHQDVVFWSPMQVKAHARETLNRPKGWIMGKADMVDTAKKDALGGVWNHNEADAYLVARLAGRFWLLYEGVLAQGDLSPVESKYFTEVHKFVRGKHAGQEKKRGVLYREDERFFLWSKEIEDAEGKAAEQENG